MITMCMITIGNCCRAAALVVPLLLAGCDAVGGAAADLRLKPGTYSIEAKGGQKRKWHDLVIVSESQSDSILKNILPVFQNHMRPSDGASSWKASDRPCSTKNFESVGGKFTATGTCQIISAEKTTEFRYKGTSYGNAFKIEVEISGFGTKKPDAPDIVTIEGKISG